MTNEQRRTTNELAKPAEPASSLDCSWIMKKSFMSAVAEKLNAERFRELYAQRKPYFELLDGEAVQKAVPTQLHSIMQFILGWMLKDLGFKPRPELTMAIDQSWQPTPDVCGILGPVEDPYPTQPVAVAIEVLSPDDRFTRVIQKCRKYAEWGIQDILVFDPVGRDAWYWDAAAGDLIRIKGSYSFRSRPVELVLNEVFRRLDQEL